MGGCQCESNNQQNFDEQIDLGSTQIILYYSNENTASRALKAFLDAGKFRYEKNQVDLFKLQSHSQDILKLNPEGTVPFLLINDELFQESPSVMRLLTTIISPLASFYP